MGTMATARINTSQRMVLYRDFIIQEPDRQLCPACSAYPDETSRCQGWEEPGDFGSLWPNGCLVRQAQNAEAA